MKSARPSAVLQAVPVSASDLDRMVGPDPHRPGPARARLLVEQIPVWAIIGHIRAVGGTTEPEDASPATVAEVAVIAALRYYEQHRAAIDALLAANAQALI